MIRDLFLDLDDTLLDFGEAERHGIIRTLRELGIAPTEETLALYSRINQQQWERFERGEISREEVLIERFSLLFQALGCTHDPEDAENRYRRYLGIGHWFVPGAEALLSWLAPRFVSIWPRTAWRTRSTAVWRAPGSLTIFRKFSFRRTRASTSRKRAILITASRASRTLTPRWP